MIACENCGYSPCRRLVSCPESIRLRSANLTAHNLAVHAEAKRSRGRPRLTEGEHPVDMKIVLPLAMRDAIDATGTKRSTFAREAIAEKLERDTAAASRTL